MAESTKIYLEGAINTFCLLELVSENKSYSNIYKIKFGSLFEFMTQQEKTSIKLSMHFRHLTISPQSEKALRGQYPDWYAPIRSCSLTLLIITLGMYDIFYSNLVSLPSIYILSFYVNKTGYEWIELNRASLKWQVEDDTDGASSQPVLQRDMIAQSYSTQVKSQSLNRWHIFWMHTVGPICAPICVEDEEHQTWLTEAEWLATSSFLRGSLVRESVKLQGSKM